MKQFSIAGIEIVGVLVDNVAESGGEESEDEWNYIKGEEKSDLLDSQLLNQVVSEPIDSVRFLIPFIYYSNQNSVCIICFVLMILLFAGYRNFRYC